MWQFYHTFVVLNSSDTKSAIQLQNPETYLLLAADAAEAPHPSQPQPSPNLAQLVMFEGVPKLHIDSNLQLLFLLFLITQCNEKETFVYFCSAILPINPFLESDPRSARQTQVVWVKILLFPWSDTIKQKWIYDWSALPAVLPVECIAIHPWIS